MDRIVQAYRAAWKQYATFDGRATRLDFWGYFLVNGMILIVGPVLVVFGEGGDLTGDPAPGLVIVNTALLVYVLAQIVPSIAISVRRLHDTGHSGWWTCSVLLGLLGYPVLIVFWSLPSEARANDYGPSVGHSPTENGLWPPPVGSTRLT